MVCVYVRTCVCVCARTNTVVVGTLCPGDILQMLNVEER